MDSAITLFHQIIKMFLMMAAGYYFRKKGTINDDTTSRLSSILLMAATPCTLITSFNQEYSSQKLAGLMIALGLSFLIYLLNIAMASILCKKQDGMGKFCLIFSNAGFLGIPLVTGLLGIEMVFYLSPFISCFYLFVWTVGVVLISGNRKTVTFAKIITNPCIWATAAGIVVFLLPFKLPSAIMEAVAMVGNMNSPLAMIILGSYMAKTNLFDMFRDRRAYVISFFRLMLLPGLALIPLSFTPARYSQIAMIILIGASAPVGALAPVFAQMFHKDTDEGAQIVSLSTILCVITMPLMIVLWEAMAV